VQLILRERVTKLGRLGEVLAAEGLKRNGFTDVEDLNLRRINHQFGDLLATKNGVRYFISVKTRNEMRQGEVGMNEAYNLILISNVANAELKRQGETADQITEMLLAEVGDLAAVYDATPAWITVVISAKAGTYSAYFGLVATLGNRRSVPMTLKAREEYLCLADNLTDGRVTADLLNT